MENDIRVTVIESDSKEELQEIESLLKDPINRGIDPETVLDIRDLGNVMAEVRCSPDATEAMMIDLEKILDQLLDPELYPADPFFFGETVKNDLLEAAKLDSKHSEEDYIKAALVVGKSYQILLAVSSKLLWHTLARMPQKHWDAGILFMHRAYIQGADRARDHVLRILKDRAEKETAADAVRSGEEGNEEHHHSGEGGGEGEGHRHTNGAEPEAKGGSEKET